MLQIWVINNTDVKILVDGTEVISGASKMMYKEVDTITNVQISVVKSDIDPAVAKIDQEILELNQEKAKLLGLKP